MESDPTAAVPHKPDAADPRRRRFTPPRIPAPAAVAIVVLSLYLPHAGDGVLRLDSLLYAAVSKAIVDRGQWIPLFFGDLPYLIKPPAMFWLNAASFHALGVTAFAARLPSILLAAAAAAVVAGVAARWFGRRNAVPAGIIFATTYAVMRNSVACRLDAAVAFSIAAAVWAAAPGLAPTRATLRWTLAGLATGFGILAKGPVALLAWPAIAMETAVWRREIARRPGSGPGAPPILRGVLVPAVAAAAAAIAVAVPWYAVVSARIGPAFWEIHLGREMVGRVAAGGSSGVLAFYVAEIATTWWPWLPLGAWGAAVIARGRAAAPRPDGDVPPPVRSAAGRWAWLALTVVSIAVLAPIRPPYARYLIPFFAAAAIAAAVGIDAIPAAARIRDRIVPWLPPAAILFGIALAVAPVRLHPSMPDADAEFLAALNRASDARYAWAYRYQDWETKAFVFFYGERGVRDVDDTAACPDGAILLIDEGRDGDVRAADPRPFHEIGRRGNTIALAPVAPAVQ